VTASPDALARAGVALYAADRGGLATYHGPGQWVLFAVDRLERLTGDRRGVRKAVEGLLDVALEVGRRYDPGARIGEGAELGVWTRRGKFAAVGVHVQQGVLLHGLSVNGFRTPTSFLGLRPCGLDAPVDFLLPAPDEAAFERLGGELVQAALARFHGRVRALIKPSQEASLPRT
jgi:lipoate-protein ligase B